uniref:SXP/RAL-2 family protein Ani s 5-like cation-binding domain-containing protein n=1 Tax=Panagrellus redivivus TaxID=6233 RepID=A0A7E4ZSB0_PANRE
MRLFAIFVVTGIVAVGITHELSDTPAVRYYGAAYRLLLPLVKHSAYAIESVRSEFYSMNFDDRKDPYARNYTTLSEVVNFLKILYDDVVQNGLNKTEYELRASNHLRLKERKASINESIEAFATADGVFAEFQESLQQKYENEMQMIKNTSSIQPLNPLPALSDFYKQSKQALSKWATVLMEVGTYPSLGPEQWGYSL